jgi:hypothetical protein
MKIFFYSNMKKIAKATLFFILINSSPLRTQTDLEHKAPTLQIGLDGLSFAKGGLDAKLIMEIIAQKQQELKIIAVQNMFLKKLENSGGTVYNFGDNVIKAITEEADQKVRTRKVLENAVNLVFTMSFLEYYLSNSKLDTELLGLANYYGLTGLTRDKINLREISKTCLNRKTTPAEKDKYLELITLFLDISTEAIRSDDKLQQLGLMQISYSQSYTHLNKYYELFEEKGAEVASTQAPNRIQRLFLRNSQITALKTSSISATPTQTLATNLLEDMKLLLSNLTKKIGLINYYKEELSFRQDDKNILRYSVTVNTVTSISNYSNYINPVVIDSLKDVIKKMSLLSDWDNDKMNNELPKLSKIMSYLKKANEFASSTTSISLNISTTLSDILYTINNEFIPSLEQNLKYNTKLVYVIEELQASNKNLYKYLLQDANFDDNNINSEKFTVLISKLYQFNKAGTISDYLKYIDDVSQNFPVKEVRDALSTLTTFIKDYSTIVYKEDGKDVLSFNAESFILKLQSIKSERLKRLQLNFTVGTNNASFFNNNAIILTDGSELNNFSYVSEKIGIKYKLWDWSNSRTRDPGEAFKRFKYGHYIVRNVAPVEPIVSNWHLLAYGSGILYNLVNASTSKEFNLPLLGIGTGLTFVNALDFNVSYGIPILKNEPFENGLEHAFVNIGFDIQFTEYISKLNEKRQLSKVQKALTQSAN